MKACWIGAALAAGLMMAVTASETSALAQSALDGPLATPDAAPATHAKRKPRKAHHAAAKTAKMPAAAEADAAVPRPTSAEAPARAAPPVDPVDLGMKWNGTSDGSAQTRFQNGLDGAFGSGAEVGMKLHF